MNRKRIRDVGTLEKLKKTQKVRSYEMFETRAFFKDKQLEIVEILSLAPLRILVSIATDNTTYAPSKGIENPTNEGKLLEIKLSDKREVEVGAILKSENAYVEFDYDTAYVAIVAHTELFITANTIILVSKDQPNLREFYSGGDS